MQRTEKVLKALANRRRLEMVRYLRENREATVGNLARHIKLSFKATSKHLAVLVGADVVSKEQRSIFACYSLAGQMPPLAKMIITKL